MNPNSTHADWHPGESPDWLADAIAKVRAEVAAESAGMAPVTREGGRRATEAPEHGSKVVYGQTVGSEDYAVGEWYHNHRIIRGEELEGVYRRMNRRGDIITDVQNSGRNGGLMTVIRSTPPTVQRKPSPGIAKVCGHCGALFFAKSKSAKWCGTACASAADKVRRKARRMEGGRG